MFILKRLNRYMERNQAASKAMLTQLDASSIEDLTDIDPALWHAISISCEPSYTLTITDDGSLSFHFVVRLFIKIGFSCDDAVRLMMDLHRFGQVELARADSDALERLKQYINDQAHSYGQVIKVDVLMLK